jgi:hypothetical protein
MKRLWNDTRYEATLSHYLNLINLLFIANYVWIIIIKEWKEFNYLIYSKLSAKNTSWKCAFQPINFVRHLVSDQETNRRVLGNFYDFLQNYTWKHIFFKFQPL